MPHTLKSAVHSELIIRKSRFIGCVQPMADRAGAQAVVDALRRQRNLCDYEGDPVAAATLQAALQAADKLLVHAEGWLRQHHPEWKLA